MARFIEKPGKKSAFRYLKHPFSDIGKFEEIVREIVLKNPFDCTSYMKKGRNHPPVEKVREKYTAKFVYEDADGKQVGNGLDMYTSAEGYQYGIAAVISNMANVAAHGGKVRHDPASDLFSVTLQCNDPAPVCSSWTYPAGNLRSPHTGTMQSCTVSRTGQIVSLHWKDQERLLTVHGREGGHLAGNREEKKLFPRHFNRVDIRIDQAVERDGSKPSGLLEHMHETDTDDRRTGILPDKSLHLLCFDRSIRH
ncbi:MAG: hypothetical protein A4E34_00275 [Methanoregula sp. PtaU1.Bin006]|nr:MAG: hypothetical protein A4E33_02640 [Methanoregula sp. PtaB.Bin085]OPY36581.1 MAG: hypothetical protein A4E34_00275 [Methanoregula sp. PtaU1.Bin006]